MKTHRTLRYFALVSMLAAFLVLASSALAVNNVSSFTGNIASGAQYDLYEVDLIAGSTIVGTVTCDPLSPTLDTILTAFFPGNPHTDDTSFADVYNDDGGDASCGGFRNSTFSFVTPTTGTYTFRVDGFGSSTGAYLLTISVDPNNNPMLTDGRINGQQAAPIILYCDGTTVKGYSTSGVSLFSVESGGTTSGAWGAVGTAPDGRMLVSGWFNDGKAYYFAFEGCPHGKYDAFSGEPPQLFDSGSY